MNTLAAVQTAMERLLAEDPDPLLELSAEDVSLTVIGSSPGAETETGRHRLAEYFGALGGIVTFWRLRYLPLGDQVLVLGQERFGTTGGLEAASDFAIVLTLRDGCVAEVLVIEDLAEELRRAASLSTGAEHADDHHDGRYRDLLQGLGDGATGRLQPRVAPHGGRLGGPDALPGRRGLPLHRA